MWPTVMHSSDRAPIGGPCSQIRPVVRLGVAEHAAAIRASVESMLIFGDSAWGRLGGRTRCSHPPVRHLNADFRRCGPGKVGCGRAACTNLTVRRMDADFRKCSLGGDWVWPSTLQPSDRSPTEGRFPQMLPGRGWAAVRAASIRPCIY